MVSPVTSSVQQQIPAANTFQPGGNTEEVRQKDREQTRPAGTAAAESQSTETRNNGRKDEVQASASRNEDNGQASARSSRGSVVDLTA
jgi:hypothetical protein